MGVKRNIVWGLIGMVGLFAVGLFAGQMIADKGWVKSTQTEAAAVKITEHKSATVSADERELAAQVEQEKQVRQEQIRKEREAKHQAYLETLKTAPGQQIGTFSTSLAGHSAEGRVKNIVLANQKLDGKILLPGDAISFNETLGDSNDPNGGWQLATVIVGKKFEQGYGGGICQVSSTLYNSVTRAGLEVLERHTHSLPVGYVPAGQDATVSYPELDFRFQNSLDAPVKIHTFVDGGNVMAKLYKLPKEE
jgi:vancomycin resistance protein YoaR